MFRSLFLAAALMAFTPLAANAGEITLLPSIKLQIGDRDHYGNYWDGGHWRDRDYWHRNYEWRKNRWWRHGKGPKNASCRIFTSGNWVFASMAKPAEKPINEPKVARYNRLNNHR